jgi:alkaline phosphatase D
VRVKRVSRRRFLALTSLGVAAACGGEDAVSTNGTGGTGPGSGGAGGAGGGGTGGQGTGAGGQGGEGGAPPVGPGPEPTDPWDPGGQLDELAFPFGVQTGDALPTAVLVSFRSLEPMVSLSVARGVEGGWEEVVTMMAVGLDDGMVHLELDELWPDTTYAITFFAEDGIRRSRVARFRTAIDAGERRVVRFGASSCLGDDDEPWPSLSHSLDERLDFFLLLGDTIYADNNPDAFVFDTKYETALSLSGLNDLTAGTSVVATWDDHEIDNNWSWSDSGIQQLYDEALAAFRKYVPQREGPVGVLWRKLSWGDAVDLFVLDCRGERQDGNYISSPQMDWLKQELSASTATFKVILNSVPIFDFSGTVIGPFSTDDRWQGYPTQRTEILQHIANAGIGGVLWVAGDVHFGAVGKVDPAGGTSRGPMGGHHRPGRIVHQRVGRLVADERADAGRGHRTQLGALRGGPRRGDDEREVHR